MNCKKGTTSEHYSEKIISILFVVTIALTVITIKNENAIIIYSCMKQLRNDELQKQLNEAFPELDVYIMYMSTAKAAAKLSIEGPSSGESGECLYGESRRTYG